MSMSNIEKGKILQINKPAHKKIVMFGNGRA